MEKREWGQLAIYEIDEDKDTLSLDCLYNLFIEKTSDIIYILKDKKLYGIICMTDIIDGAGDEVITINKSFTFLEGDNVVEAHEIFRSKNIHKIPIINVQGELIGDYSRWDDMLYIKRNCSLLMKEDAVKKVLRNYENVYLIEPVEKRNSEYLGLIKYLECFGIEYIILKKEQIRGILTENAVCIFLNEDERRGVQCLYKIAPRVYDDQGYNNFRFDMPEDARWTVRLATYKSLLYQLGEESQLERLNIEKPFSLLYENIDEKITILLSELQQRGLKCIHLCQSNEVEKLTEFEKNFRKAIREKEKTYYVDLRTPWPKKEENGEFYADLYQNEDYEIGIAQREIADAWRNFEYGKDIVGKYFNAKAGRRVTCFQPNKYIGTIYLVGGCTVIGAFQEDAHTIGSFLQKKLLERGYAYRVENLGTWTRYTSIENRLKEVDRFYENDILIMINVKRVIGLPEISFEKIYERHKVSAQCVTNMYLHCNWKVNKLVAEEILEVMQPHLLTNGAGSGNVLHIDFKDIMNSYIYRKYLSVYFGDFPYWKYHKIGAVVINSNPFTKGHRYLIEQARSQVEFLIVFVVEEDVSIFSFEERFKMVVEGTKEFDNVMVVPSSCFILSKNNFPEYFTYRGDKSVVIHAEYDITVFAEYIAKPLHITHRFAGEESEDRMKIIYNEAMRTILPRKGIEFVEIPRMKVINEYITGNKVVRFLKFREYDKAFAMLTNEIKDYLVGDLL